jgi:hypothetical protein
VDDIDRLLARLARQPFRARFHLRGADLATARRHGPFVLRQHALDLITERVAPAAPRKDGKQTPYRGHPVFVAQHATATCCRTCLQRWHGIPKGQAITGQQRAYVVEVISRWIGQEVAAADGSAPAAASSDQEFDRELGRRTGEDDQDDEGH